MNDNCAILDDDWTVHVPSKLGRGKEWHVKPIPENEHWETVPRSERTVTVAIESIQARFENLAQGWANDTQHLSSPSQIMMHPSYQAILGLARENETELIRVMLNDLRSTRRPWFWALSYLTKENPIQPSDGGKMDRMIQSWINWGTRKGIL